MFGYNNSFSLIKEADIFELLLFLKIIEKIKLDNRLCYGVVKLLEDYDYTLAGVLMRSCNISYEGKSQIWYISEELMEECYYKDGKKEGKFQSWWKNGQLIEECYYKNEKEEGKYHRWHENGQLSVKCYYKNGELEGKYQEWWDDGHLGVEMLLQKWENIKLN